MKQLLWLGLCLQTASGAAAVDRFDLSNAPFYCEVVLTKTNGIEEILFNGRDCSLARKRDSAMEFRKRRATGCVALLVKGRRLAQRTPSAFLERLCVQWMVLYRVLDALVCSMERSGLSCLYDENIVQTSRCEMRSVLDFVSSSSRSTIILRIMEP